MDREVRLEMVKQALNIADSSDLDNALLVYIDVVTDYLKGAGISDSIINTEKANGTILKGVSDLYINNELSQTFYQFAIQLALKR